MDIRQLSYFIRVAQEESYSEAAKKLTVSQPALSMAMKSLEEELGAKLFYSFGRRQLLTDEGKNLYTHAQRLMDVYRETAEAVGSHSRDSFGSISIGLPPIIGTCYFSDLVADFTKDYPHVSVSIVEEGAREIEGLVAEGLVDIACTIGPVYNKGFETKRIITEQNVVLVPAGHRLAKHKAVKLEDLQNEAFAIFNKDFVLHEQIVTACRQAGFDPQIAVLSSQWDFQAEVVRTERAVSILPQPIIRRFPLEGVQAIPLHESAGVLRYWDIILVWNKNRYLSKTCTAFLAYVDNKFK